MHSAAHKMKEKNKTIRYYSCLYNTCTCAHVEKQLNIHLHESFTVQTSMDVRNFLKCLAESLRTCIPSHCCNLKLAIVPTCSFIGKNGRHRGWRECVYEERRPLADCRNLSFSSVSRLLIIHIGCAVQKNEHLWCRGCWLATTPCHTGLHRCCCHSGCNDHTGILPVCSSHWST